MHAGETGEGLRDNDRAEVVTAPGPVVDVRARARNARLDSGLD